MPKKGYKQTPEQIDNERSVRRKALGLEGLKYGNKKKGQNANRNNGRKFGQTSCARGKLD